MNCRSSSASDWYAVSAGGVRHELGDDRALGADGDRLVAGRASAPRSCRRLLEGQQGRGSTRTACGARSARPADRSKVVHERVELVEDRDDPLLLLERRHRDLELRKALARDALDLRPRDVLGLLGVERRRSASSTRRTSGSAMCGRRSSRRGWRRPRRRARRRPCRRPRRSRRRRRSRHHPAGEAKARRQLRADARHRLRRGRPVVRVDLAVVDAGDPVRRRRRPS